MPKSNFKERIRELRPMHFLVIFVFTVIFFGVLFGIYNYRQSRITTKEINLEIITPTPGQAPYSADSIVVEGITEKNIYVKVG